MINNNDSHNNNKIAKYYPQELFIFFTSQQLDQLILDKRLYQKFSKNMEKRKNIILSKLRENMLPLIAFLISNNIYSKEEIIQSFFNDSSLQLITIKRFIEISWQEQDRSSDTSLKIIEELIKNKIISPHAIRSMIKECGNYTITGHPDVYNLDRLLSFAKENIFLLEKDVTASNFINEALKILPFGKSLAELILVSRQSAYGIEITYKDLVIPKAHPTFGSKLNITSLDIYEYYHNERIKLFFSCPLVNTKINYTQHRKNLLFKTEKEQQEILEFIAYFFINCDDKYQMDFCLQIKQSLEDVSEFSHNAFSLLNKECIEIEDGKKLAENFSLKTTKEQKEIMKLFTNTLELTLELYKNEKLTDNSFRANFLLQSIKKQEEILAKYLKTKPIDEENEQVKILFKNVGNESQEEFSLKTSREQREILAKFFKIDPIDQKKESLKELLKTIDTTKQQDFLSKSEEEQEENLKNFLNSRLTDKESKQAQKMFKIMNDKIQKEFLSKSEGTKFVILYNQNLHVKLELEKNPAIGFGRKIANAIPSRKFLDKKETLESVMFQPSVSATILSFLGVREQVKLANVLINQRINHSKQNIKGNQNADSPNTNLNNKSFTQAIEEEKNDSSIAQKTNTTR